jgi:acetyl/propionyl-CoA carboxylase alpha subunit
MNNFQFEGASRGEQHEPGSDRVRVDGAIVTVQRDGPGRFIAQLDGRSVRLHAVADGDQVWVHWRGRAWALKRIDPTRATGPGGAAAAGTAHAPMPGVVVSLQVAPRQTVSVGDALLVIESMKLQTTICAAIDGVVTELPLTVGQSFERGAVLARLQGAEDAR